MVKLIKKKIYEYSVYISLFLIAIAVRINSHKLSAFIIWINIRRSKEVKSSLKFKKKILVFPKSGGYEDLIETYYNKKDSNIIFYLLPRIFLKKIFSYYFDKNFEKDYFTKLNNSEDIHKKNSYVTFLSLTFKSISRYLKFDAFISFNLFYYAEKYFEEVCKNLDTKFIILHKESVFNPLEEKNAHVIYKKFNDRSLSHKISVYSESQKKILIQSKIGTKGQIKVNGIPRCDYAFRLRNIIPKKKIIVFYLIETYRNTNYLVNDKKKNWNKLLNQTLKYLIELAKNNPNINVVLKGKIGVHEKYYLKLKNLPKNCTFIYGGSGEKLLRDASVVIAFNSTIVFETIASNRNLIIPNFNKENILRKNLIHEIKNSNYLVNTKKQFNEKLKIYLNSRYKNKKLSIPDIQTLKYYIGNTDGRSGKKMQKFLNKVLN